MRSEAWALVGAVVGAGFASGREIASFFSQFGHWSWLAVAAALAALAGIGLSVMRAPGIPENWHGRWQEGLWRGLFSALMAVTGGAMLAGAGEIAALTLPLPGAYWMGLLATVTLAILISEQNIRGLAAVSRILTVCLLAVLVLGFWAPERKAVWVEHVQAWRKLPESLLRGVCYGGFNAALASPALEELSSCLSPGEKRRCMVRAVTVLGGLLSLGNAMLLRHPALLDAPLPYVEVLGTFGRSGMLLGAVTLYLAMLTTLVTCLRGLRAWLGQHWPLLLPVGVALIGFSGAVDILYPFLGGLCFLLLAAKAIHR